MKLIRIFERGGDDAQRFDEAMKRAKSGLMEACEIWEDMKEQFSERDDYSERGYSERGNDFRRDYGRTMYRDAEGDWSERRSRGSNGRYM